MHPEEDHRSRDRWLRRILARITWSGISISAGMLMRWAMRKLWDWIIDDMGISK